MTMTIHDIERQAAEHGIRLTPAQRAEIAAAQQAERQRLEAVEAQTGATWADQWAGFYPRLLGAISSIGDTIITLAKTSIVALGVPIMLVLVLIVEHHRVRDGIALFEVVGYMADLGAWVIVLANLVLEFVIHYEETRHGWRPPQDRRASLRLWLHNAAYRLGLGDEWQPMPQSPAQRYKGLLRLVTVAALGLALFGSMRSAIQDQSGRWTEAIVAIVAESSLAEMTTWLGGLLFALAAVLVAQGLSRYVAIRAVEIVATMEGRTVADPYAAKVEEAGAMVALAIIRQQLDAREARKHKAAAAVKAAPPVVEVGRDDPSLPFGPTAPTADALASMAPSASASGSLNGANGSANGSGSGH